MLPSSSLLVLLLIPTLRLSGVTCRKDSPTRPSGTNHFDGSDLSERWLLPILVFGPNNQVTGLKEGLVLARLLGRTAILPSIYEHYSQEVSGKFHHRFTFDDVFDDGNVSKFTKVVKLKDLQSRGWNGQLDALLYWGEGHFDYLPRIRADHVGFKEAERIAMSGQAVCEEEHAVELKKQLSGHRVIGAPIYNTLVVDARHSPLSTTSLVNTNQHCYQLYREASTHLHKAAHMQAIAAQFIESHFGAHPFVAVHVRPYPDTCLKLWQKGVLDTDSAHKAKDVCDNPTLHTQIGKQTRAALHLVGLSAPSVYVYVASHPGARAVITDAFEKQGLIPVYLESSFVLRALLASGHLAQGDHFSLTHVLFVEQEIALRSAAFVGTLDSSISGMIRQERGARGIPQSLSPVFTR